MRRAAAGPDVGFLPAIAAVSGEWARLDLGRLSWDTLTAIGWLAVPGSIVAFTAYIYALRA